MKLIQNIKNLFKIYDLLNNKDTLIVDTSVFENDKWYFISGFIKRTKDKPIVDDYSICQFKTDKKTREAGKKLRAYYKVNKK